MTINNCFSINNICVNDLLAFVIEHLNLVSKLAEHDIMFDDHFFYHLQEIVIRKKYRHFSASAHKISFLLLHLVY